MSRTENTTNGDSRVTKKQGIVRRRLRDCRCGQQLDVVARAHCPRCGRCISAH
ncbi:MAG TPA: hypothetical protein VFQ11_12640 [Nocardioidaceae bacterium]|jgi:hypothetical protein|nr:hypothetical protein [Nocardioidaceae bacterium]